MSADGADYFTCPPLKPIVLFNRHSASPCVEIILILLTRHRNWNTLMDETVVCPNSQNAGGRVMKSLVMFALLVLCAAPCYGQISFGGRADRYDSNSFDTQSGPYGRYDSQAIQMNRLMQQNRYSANPPKLYSGSGQYLGELSTNRYAPDSISNPYGNFGSRYSPTSVNNPYSPYGQYRTQPIYIAPSRW